MTTNAWQKLDKAIKLDKLQTKLECTLIGAAAVFIVLLMFGV